MRLMLKFVCAALLTGVAAAQNIPVVGVESGATLESIAGTPTLVTIVLKARGAKDPNLRILEATADYVAVLNESNDRYSYLVGDIQEIQVQGGKVEKAALQLPQHASLRVEDQKTLARVWLRIREIFGNANDNRELKITAAMLLAVNGEDDAEEYLKMLAESNDLAGQLEAALALYLAGAEVPQSIISQGLASGNRRARAKAATLAGLTGFRDAIPILNSMVQDRTPDLSAPAARALARLGNREIIPKLIDMLGGSQQAADAAIYALTLLGGEDVIAQMRLRVNTVQGLERYRVVLVLYNLGDDLGRQLLLETFTLYPTLQPEAALILAKEKNWDATQFLRARLARREDPTDQNLLFRARNAAALFLGGDPTAQTVFQELLRSENKVVIDSVCKLITEIGDRKLISILQPTIESIDNRTTLDAGGSIVSLAFSDFRTRLLEVRRDAYDSSASRAG